MAINSDCGVHSNTMLMSHFRLDCIRSMCCQGWHNVMTDDNAICGSAKQCSSFNELGKEGRHES